MADLTGWQAAGAIIQLIGSIVALVGLTLVINNVRRVIADYFGIPHRRDVQAIDVTTTIEVETRAVLMKISTLRGTVDEKLEQIQSEIHEVREEIAELEKAQYLASLHAGALEDRVGDAERSARNYTDQQLQRRADEAKAVSARDVAIALGGIGLTIVGQAIALLPLW